MLYIDINSIEVSKARVEHVAFFKCRVTKKLTGTNCQTANCPICNKTRIQRWKSRRAIKDRVKLFLNAKIIEEILQGVPKNLVKINRKLFDSVLPISGRTKLRQYLLAKDKQRSAKRFKIIHNLFEDLNKVFDYNWFIDQPPTGVYSAYKLALNLDRRSCTYCNRTYTTTMTTDNGEKVMRLHFDHWYPKSKFPLLAISFYNLIPSCYTCNSSVKGDIELNISDHIHPYVDAAQTSDFEFDFYFDGGLNRYKIFLVKKGDARAKSTLEKLKIDVVYNSHLPELEDMILIEKSYSKVYIDEIKKLFKNSNLTDNQIYRILFGTELDIVDFHRQPLSKFKKDILRKIGLIP